MKKLILTQSTQPAHSKQYRIRYEDVLNASQYQAVMHTNGPALVLAGAGTGKTRTLTYRVARLVEDGIDPTNILLLTFTRKAANAMTRRAAALLDGRCEKVVGGTFHSFGFRILQRFGKGLGVAAGIAPVSVLDQIDAQDAMGLVRSRIIDIKTQKRFPKGATIANMVSKSVNSMIPLDDVISQEYPSYAYAKDVIGEIVRSYQTYKQDHCLVDYDDLLLLTLSATRHEEVAAYLRRQFKHIMIDEYQDTNPLQHAIIMGLAGPSGNVMAVGDDAQSIYAFRGARIENIHAYPNSFSTCKTIKLEQNYRSTQPILDVCNAILKNAPDLFQKNLHSSRVEGEQPILVACSNERQQSDFIVQQVLGSQEQGLSLNNISVLFRNSYLSFDLEIALAKANIPFRKVGGIKFLEAAHVKDVLALMRITENPRDALAWYRCLQLLPSVGSRIAESVLTQLLEQPNPLQGSLPQLPAKVVSVVSNLVQTLQDAAAVQQPEHRMRMIVAWYKPILERKYDEAGKRWKDVETICAICAQYQNASRFLADVAIETPSKTLDATSQANEDDEEMLTLSTIHSAKGLEWDTVIVISVNEGHLPSSRSIEKTDELEEERRLLYVACTRAKETLMLSYTMVAEEGEFTDALGQPSRFLETIEAEICPRYILQVESNNEAVAEQRTICPGEVADNTNESHVIS